MAWTKLDDGIYDNPKILTVEPTDRLLYVWALCWSNRHHTDGVIPAKMLRYVAMFAGCGDHDAAASRLVEAGLWDNAPDGWTIHDFAEYQLSSDRVEDLRAKRAEAGRKGGQRSAETRRATNSPTKPEANASANGQQPGSKQASEIEPRPVPSPVTDVSSSSGTTRELSTGRDDDGPNIDLTSNPPPDDDGGDERVARAVADELGRRDSDRTPNHRAVPTKHAAACAADRWQRWQWLILDLVRANPQATVTELADMVDQHSPALATAGGGSSSHAPTVAAPDPFVIVDGERRLARTLNCPTCQGRTDHGTGRCSWADPDPAP